MGTTIGFQNGIRAAMNRLRDLDPAGTVLVKSGGKWPPLSSIANVPIEQWKAYDKLERTLTILKDDHDASEPPPDGNGPPPVTYKKVAPRVAYKAGGSDARFCTVNQPGVVPEPNAPAGHTTDESGATYDENGLCKNGLRSDGPAVTSALEIDGRPYCSLPTMGDPTANTGSWAI